MSTHATADAVDITGVMLDGTRISLLTSAKDGPKSAFLKDIRDLPVIGFV